MFVNTQNHSLINLNCYLSVAVVERDGKWQLTAFTEADRTGFSPTTAMPEFPFAVFSEEVDARYAFCHLYSALEAGRAVWNPSEVESFSDLWSQAKVALLNEIHAHAPIALHVLGTLELKITGLREITILNIRGDSRSSITNTEKDIVEKKIKNALESIDPMDKAAWKIDWKDIMETKVKLHEDQKVVEALNSILEGYPGLEYDKKLTKLAEKNTKTTDSDNNILHIKILDSKVIKKQVGAEICSKLTKRTGRKCYCSNLESQTRYLIIKERNK